MNDVNLFETRDMGEIAFLEIALGPHDSFRKIPGGPLIFIWTDGESARRESENYWSGRARVSPRAYFNSLREFKADLRRLDPR